MLSDDEVVGILRGRITRSNGYLDTELMQEREKVNLYYNGERPIPLHKGNSKYTSNDVFDAVESMKAQLIETFGGAFQPVRFMPTSEKDVEEARIATEVVNFVVDRQNNGWELKQNVIHDGLVARIGVAKVWWEKSEEECEETFEGTGDDMANYMATNPTAEPQDAEMDETGYFKSATFTKTADTSQVKIMTLAPEEFGISGGCSALDDADLLFHRQSKTASELEAMGFDPDIIEDLPLGSEWLHDQEARVRAGGADYNPFEHDSADEKAGKRIEVFECYTKIDMTGKGTGSSRRLWKLIIAGNTLLDKEEVKRHPFVLFVPLPRAHTVWGENYAKRVIATQNARTALMRSIIDHAVITTNPRWTVLRNGLMDPRELMENKIGGVVNMTKPDAIGLLPQASLNPFIYNTIGLLDSDREEVTGISKLSQGLNKDAISQQNSGSMVEQLISVSQIRQKVIARRFAEFLRALYTEVFQLVVENASKQFSISVAGNWVQIDPSSLQNRKDVTVDFALGYGEKDKEGQKWVNIDKYLSADPKLAPAYGPTYRYHVITQALQGMGVKDVHAVIQDPATIKPQPPDPMHVLQQQKLQADIAMETAQAQSMTAKVQMEQQKLQMEHQIQMAKLQLEQQKLTAQNQLEQQKITHKQQIDAAELRLAIEQEANAQDIITTPKA